MLFVNECMLVQCCWLSFNYLADDPRGLSFALLNLAAELFRFVTRHHDEQTTASLSRCPLEQSEHVHGATDHIHVGYDGQRVDSEHEVLEVLMMRQVARVS